MCRAAPTRATSAAALLTEWRVSVTSRAWITTIAALTSTFASVNCPPPRLSDDCHGFKILCDDVENIPCQFDELIHTSYTLFPAVKILLQLPMD